MTYDLRRLRLHGLIERIPRSHRYHLTSLGRRVAILFSRVYARVLRPSLSEAVAPHAPHGTFSPQLRRAFDALGAGNELGTDRALVEGT